VEQTAGGGVEKDEQQMIRAAAAFRALWEEHVRLASSQNAAAPQTATLAVAAASMTATVQAGSGWWSERPWLERAPFERSAQRQSDQRRAVWDSCVAAREEQRQRLCRCFDLPGTASWAEVKAADAGKPGTLRWNHQWQKYYKR
jgi:hypothetical protein